MRTLEQILRDRDAIDKEIATAQKKRDRFNAELAELKEAILNAA